jgi:hypothetical protein
VTSLPSGPSKETPYCVSPFGQECDEFGDQGLTDIARVRLGGLPPEGDLHLELVPRSAVEAHVARHGSDHEPCRKPAGGRLGRRAVDSDFTRSPAFSSMPSLSGSVHDA